MAAPQPTSFSPSRRPLIALFRRTTPKIQTSETARPASSLAESPPPPHTQKPFGQCEGLRPPFLLALRMKKTRTERRAGPSLGSLPSSASLRNTPHALPQVPQIRVRSLRSRMLFFFQLVGAPCLVAWPWLLAPSRSARARAVRSIGSCAWGGLIFTWQCTVEPSDSSIGVGGE